MSWYQSVAGAEVILSPSVEKRIGVDGFGLDDIGVMLEPDTVVALFNVGQALGAIDDDQISEFVALGHGSLEQVEAASSLGTKSLIGLRDAIDRQVREQLLDVPGTTDVVYREYRDWARESLWELPVGCIENYSFQCFCITDDAGLSVFECPVAKMPGRIGDVLLTIVHELAIDALKTPSLDAVSYVAVMSLDPSVMSGYENFESIRHADGETILEWLKKVDPEMHNELVFWDDYAERTIETACVLRDVAFAHHDERERIERVVGDANDECRDSRGKYLARIRQMAEDCEPGVLRDFALAACELLGGTTTRELVEKLPPDQRFERLPGDLSLLDTGIAVGDIHEYYNHINEMALNNDEIALLPLQGPPDIIIALLTRITVCERLILALAALLNEDAELSDAQAA